MSINPDIYDYRNLNDSDKEKIDLIEEIKQEVLSGAVVEDFIDTKEVTGSTLRGIYLDVLNAFIEFLSERIEYAKVDYIITAIDGYSEEEFSELCKTAKNKQLKGVKRNDNPVD